MSGAGANVAGERARAERPFLTAQWRDLCILNYAVNSALLLHRLPRGLELDTRNGRAFVSLVAFDFRGTRVMGVSWPGLRNFPEINLRFYVRRGERRGVVFVREYVPSRVTGLVARLRYNEPYHAAPMRSAVLRAGDDVAVEHAVQRGGREHTVRVDARGAAHRPPESSDAHWFKEHSWGYGVSRRGRVMEYEVEHPVWDVHDVHRADVNVDWGALYGPEWAHMNGREPDSAVFAAGSEVRVYRGRGVDG